MSLEIVKFGHPILRRRGDRVHELTPEIRKLISDMLDTMRKAKGVGLAAQQVGVAIQLAVIDVRGVEDRQSTLKIQGLDVDPADYMPMALMNPVIIPIGPKECGPEGCLSFPEIFTDIVRPSVVEVRAMNKDWQPMEFICGGLLARAIQHEADHLNGVLFIDRMENKDRNELQDALDDLQAETKEKLRHPQ